MKIDIPKISPDGSSYQGEESGSILGLEHDKFAHAESPVKYDLFAQVVSHELVVRGTLSADLSLLCSRCAGFFSTNITISSFLRAYPIREGVESVDLTEDIREDILLEIPSYPACSWKGTGVCPYSGVDLGELKMPELPEQESRWDVLNQLKQPGDTTGRD